MMKIMEKSANVYFIAIVIRSKYYLLMMATKRRSDGTGSDPKR